MSLQVFSGLFLMKTMEFRMVLCRFDNACGFISAQRRGMLFLVERNEHPLCFFRQNGRTYVFVSVMFLLSTERATATVMSA